MTTHPAPQHRLRTLAHRAHTGFRTVFAAIDAGSRIAHGIEVPPGHPARRREQDCA